MIVPIYKRNDSSYFLEDNNMTQLQYTLELIIKFYVDLCIQENKSYNEFN